MTDEIVLGRTRASIYQLDERREAIVMPDGRTVDAVVRTPQQIQMACPTCVHATVAPMLEPCRTCRGLSLWVERPPSAE